MLSSVSDRLAPQVIWQGIDGSFALASRCGVAARYFALRHPLPARRIVRRVQKRTSRIARLARLEFLNGVGLARPATLGRPWWVDPAATALRSDVVDWLLLSGPDADDKSLGFLFQRGDRSPSAVAKIAALPAAVSRVERGYRALERLEMAGAIARGLAPKPLAFLADPNGSVVSIEAAIHGAWLDSMLRRGNEVAMIRKVTDWMVELATLTRGREREDAWSLLFSEVVDRFRDNVIRLVDPGLLGAACSVIADVKRVPTVFEHHDCAPWNFYVTRDHRLVAFDWDNANPLGVPAFDLVQALGHAAFSIDGSVGTCRFAESLRRREQGPRGVVRRESRSRYAAALGLDASTICAIRVFAWMRLATDELEIRRRAGRPARRDDVERSMLGAWIAEACSAMDS